MARINFLQTNFTSGEISPLMLGRVDFSKYYNGVEILENVFVKATGGAFRRPGTYFVSSTKYSDKKTRLISFKYSTEQAYIIEVGHQYMRFYKDGGRIEVGGSPVEISTPYDEADIFDLSFVQSADTLFIAHRNYAPRKLLRYSHTSWALEVIDYSDDNARPALMDMNTSDTTITPTAGTGNSITLTASTSIFNTDHIGSIWKICSAKSVNAPAWQTNKSYVVGDYITYEEEIYHCISAHTSGSDFERDLDAGKWSPQDIYVKITGITNGTTATGEILYGAKLESSPVATKYWYEGAWSDYRGYPACVTFFEERLYWASTYDQPQTIWGSKTNDFYNMELGDKDDDAVCYTIADNQVNAINWIIASRLLSIGTSDGTFTVEGDSNLGITPTSIRVKRQSSYGSSVLPPKQIGNYLFYIQKNNRTIRQFFYDFTSDSYRSQDLTLLSEHITESGIWDWDYQESPENILWLVRNDGYIVAITLQLDQAVGAWYKIITDGEFKSVVTIPNGEEDQIWVIVEREINGSTCQYVEYFMPFNMPDAQEDCFYVDCGLTYDGTPVDELSGLDHLEGKEVAILADGAVHPKRVVSNGSITLNDNYSVVQVGLPYTTAIFTLPIEVNFPFGTTQASIKRVYEVTVRLYRSLNCKIGRPGTLDEITFEDEYEIKDLIEFLEGEYKTGRRDIVYFRDSSMPMDFPPLLVTADKRITFPVGYDKRAQVYITQEDPLPLNVLAVISKVEIAEE